jgi:hypothetical protein
MVRRTSFSSLLGDLALRAHFAGQWRDADLWSLEVGGSLGWRSLFLRAGYQAPAEWDFQGRPVEVSAVPLLAGWRPTLWRRGRLRLGVLAALVVERLALQRTDLAHATTHSYWDTGMAAGLTMDMGLTRWLAVGIRLEGSWFPDGRDVVIPDGPSAALNRLGLQLALQLAVARGR